MTNTTLPFLNQYASIQNIIDYGRGLAANVVGQPGGVYRLSATSTGDYVQTSNQVYANFPVLRRVVTSGASVEGRGMSDLVMFDIVCDLNDLKVGDIWVQSDPLYGAGANQVSYPTDEFVGFAVAHHAVMKKSIALQLQRSASIYRMVSGVSQSGYANSFQQQAHALYISGGKAMFSPTAVASMIPIGMSPRAGGFEAFMHPKIASLPEAPEFVVYVPPIEGFIPTEGDIVQTALGARYSIMNSWHLDAGIAGSAFIVRKVTPQESAAIS